MGRGARVVNGRVLGLALPTVGHALLQQGQAASGFFDVSLGVVGLPVRGQVPWVLGHVR